MMFESRSRSLFINCDVYIAIGYIAPIGYIGWYIAWMASTATIILIQDCLFSLFTNTVIVVAIYSHFTVLREDTDGT